MQADNTQHLVAAARSRAAADPPAGRRRPAPHGHNRAADQRRVRRPARRSLPILALRPTRPPRLRSSVSAPGKPSIEKPRPGPAGPAARLRHVTAAPAGGRHRPHPATGNRKTSSSATRSRAHSATAERAMSSARPRHAQGETSRDYRPLLTAASSDDHGISWGNPMTPRLLSTGGRDPKRWRRVSGRAGCHHHGRRPATREAQPWRADRRRADGVSVRRSGEVVALSRCPR